jgi:hydroxymethylpyrimidine/phosphomethylpyrimidine kinase
LVLAIGGHDPSGGAGIQADIEAIHASGGRALTLVTALTAQDARSLRHCRPTDANDLREQAALLFESMPIAAIKIGLVPNVALIGAIADLLAQHPHILVVLDPVLAASVGNDLTGRETREAMPLLLARATITTPNTDEATALTDSGDPDSAAAQLLAAGCPNVLVTGTHGTTVDVVNRLYGASNRRAWRWRRLPHNYHGSGCTLAASLATWLARGTTVEAACTLAQAFTWRSLANGIHPDPRSDAQWHPERLDSTAQPDGVEP